MKTNIGHLESAAGVAGVVKVVLAMQQGIIPPHLHFRNLSPQMDWEKLPLRVTAEATEWPRRAEHPPLAGVSGFGWSGTNAHVVVEGYGAVDGTGSRREDARGAPVGGAQRVAVEVPDSLADGAPGGADPVIRGLRLLPLSGKSPAAVRALAGRYLAWLEARTEELSSGAEAGALLADMAWTASVGRSHFPFRTAVEFRDPRSLRSGLRALVEAEASASDAPEPHLPARVAFAFTGQAGPWLASAPVPYFSEPVVRAVLDRCEQTLWEERGASLLEAMFERPGAAGHQDRGEWTRPAVYALRTGGTVGERGDSAERGPRAGDR